MSNGLYPDWVIDMLNQHNIREAQRNIAIWLRLDAEIEAFTSEDPQMVRQMYQSWSTESGAQLIAEGSEMFFRGVPVHLLIAKEQEMGVPVIERCEKCNGITRISIPPEVTAGTGWTWESPPHEEICHCPTEPAPKHDGKLDEDGHLTAQFKYGKYVQVRNSESEYGFEGGDRLLFNGKEFLSLLDWGEQNRTELHRLAKEQEG